MKKNKVKVISITMAALIIASVLAFATLVQPVSAQTLSFKTKWGTSGTGAGQFNGPEDIIVDSLGNIYVADGNNNRIQRFIFANPCPAGTTQIVTGVCHVFTFGASGAGAGQFNHPEGVEVDSTGNLYVAERFNNRIQKFTFANPCPAGTTQIITGVCHVFTLGGTAAGTAAGQFNDPEGVALDSMGNLYTSERGGNRIQKFTFVTPPTTCPAGTTEVTSTTAIRVCHVLTFGSFGSLNGQFNAPSGIDLDASNNLYVTDTDNQRIQKFTSTGTFLLKWGTPGAGDGQFSIPEDVSIDPMGFVYVVEMGNHRIQKFQLASPCPAGTTQIVAGVCFVTKFGSFGTLDGQFSGPEGIAVNDVYVADTVNNRIQVFTPNNPPVANPDSFSVNEDTTLTVAAPGVLANDTDAEGNPLTAVLVSTTTNGTLLLNANGSFTYTPNANFNGSDSFTYRANDGIALSNIATVTITVNAVNDPPVANADTKSTAEDTPLSFPATDLTANDSPGPANESGQTLTVTGVSSPSSAGGTVLLSAGNVTYTPPPNFFGLDSFSYTICDNGSPSLCATGTVNVTVTAVNDPPVANNDAATVVENSGANVINVLANDSPGPANESGQTLTITTVSPSSNGSVAITPGGSSVTYTPNTHFDGQDSFTYIVCDNGTPVLCATATVNVTVLPIITTVAGTGVDGFNGDNIAATSAQLNFPFGVAAVGGSGRLYIADRNNQRVRMVNFATTPPTITTVAGTGAAGFNGDVDALNQPRKATTAQLSAPTGVALDGLGNLYIADNNNHRIRKVVPGADGVVNGGLDETISTVAGIGLLGFSGDGGPATSAKLFHPRGVAVDSFGSLYIADSLNQVIRKVVPGADGVVNGGLDETISTVAGTGLAGFSGDGGLATAAKLNSPIGVAVGSDLYIADEGNNRIRKVSGGNITTVAGNGTAGFSSDGGLAINAQLNAPAGVVTDGAGTVYIADLENNRIRKVSGGTITTVAGNGTAGFSGDNGPAINAQLRAPSGVGINATGKIFIADLINQRIRRVSTGPGP